jgi:hypothetical protein
MLHDTIGERRELSLHGLVVRPLILLVVVPWSSSFSWCVASGGDVFMKGVRVYLKQFAYKNASTGANHCMIVPLVIARF